MERPEVQHTITGRKRITGTLRVVFNDENRIAILGTVTFNGVEYKVNAHPTRRITPKSQRLRWQAGEWSFNSDESRVSRTDGKEYNLDAAMKLRQQLIEVVGDDLPKTVNLEERLALAQVHAVSDKIARQKEEILELAAKHQKAKEELDALQNEHRQTCDRHASLAK